jgi:hypothetical protein
MDPLGLVVHDDQTFLARVVKIGSEQGVFTRDRVDEIIRISVAMANKYVLKKEIDFRSEEELGKVQETVLNLVGVGLEIKSKGDPEEGVGLLMNVSPVELFRLAHTRIERLRNRWRLLLLNDRVEILVSAEEFENLSEQAYQRLAEMSIFTETELYTIESLKLEDDLFRTLNLVEYYESELDRFQHLLRLKEILPFDLLNKSGAVSAENLSEADSIREALINTLLVSGFLDTQNPVALSLAEIREFLRALPLDDGSDIFPEEFEESVLELIHELGEGLNEEEASHLTKEVVKTAQKLLETIVNEPDTVSSPSDGILFKRWCRLVILSDAPDPVERILSGSDEVDEFDFELLVNRVVSRPESEARSTLLRFPWARLSAEQIVRLFHELSQYQEELARTVPLNGLTAEHLIDLLDEISQEAMQVILPRLPEAFSEASFTLEDLRILAGMPHGEGPALLRMAGPPADLEEKHILREFKDGSATLRRILFHACRNDSHAFPELFAEAWSIDPSFVKKEVRDLNNAELASFFLAVGGGRSPEVTKKGKRPTVTVFHPSELNMLYRSLSAKRKQAIMEFFLDRTS